MPAKNDLMGTFLSMKQLNTQFPLGFIRIFTNIGFSIGKNASMAFAGTGYIFTVVTTVAIAVFGKLTVLDFVRVMGPMMEAPPMIVMVNTSLYPKNK